MKIVDMVFKRVGCCGEYLNALIMLDDGVEATVTDHEDGTFTIAETRDGMLISGGLRRRVSAEEVETLL